MYVSDVSLCCISYNKVYLQQICALIKRKYSVIKSFWELFVSSITRYFRRRHVRLYGNTPCEVHRHILSKLLCFGKPCVGMKYINIPTYCSENQLVVIIYKVVFTDTVNLHFIKFFYVETVQ